MKNIPSKKIDPNKLSFKLFRHFVVFFALLVSAGTGLHAQCCSLVNSLNISTGFDPVTGTVVSTGAAANVLPPGGRSSYNRSSLESYIPHAGLRCIGGCAFPYTV